MHGEGQTQGWGDRAHPERTANIPWHTYDARRISHTSMAYFHGMGHEHGHTRGAHLEHLLHVRDARGVPAGYVRIEVPQGIEELLHVGDARDAPVGDGA
eukprot:scaffold40007_cov43-Phaeocystis_antarctica.AAC.2